MTATLLALHLGQGLVPKRQSLLYGNATYVFGDDWEQFSRFTKAEVLSVAAQRDRIIHRVGWDQEIRALLARQQNRGAA